MTRCLRVLVALAFGAVACSKPSIPQAKIQVPAGQDCSAVISPAKLETSHITPPALGRYNSDPPTSGIHYGEWAKAGIYTEPIADETSVHNLEHGHVVVQYRDLSDVELGDVTAAVLSDKKMMLLAPRPTMKWKLALTSWGKIQACTTIPSDVGGLIRAFVAANRDHAPESVP